MNNFDTSTSGVNLELNIHWDQSLSAMYFEDNFTRCSDLNGSSLLNDRYSKEYRLDGNEGIIEFYNKYLTPLFEVISIRGYSQGDYAEIIFTNELMKEYNFDDKEKFISGMSDYFTNLFYDAPLHGRLEIDNNEIYLDDFQSDNYAYDKQEIILHVSETLEHEQKAYIMEWLSEELPTNLEYKY